MDSQPIALVPYLIGVFIGTDLGPFGLFILPDFCIVFQILGGMMLLAFFPMFIHLREKDGRPAAQAKH